MNWELVLEHTPGTGENSTYRLKIPEGWIYRYGSQMVFVPARILQTSSLQGSKIAS